MRLLLVEDDAMIGAAARDGLRQDGFAVDWVRDGGQAEAALATGVHEMVLLDLGLPRRDGLSILRSMRARSDETPVIILTARDAVADRVAGLDAGADDYVVKPFSLPELLARVAAMLRRVGEQRAPATALWKFGDIEVDTGTHEVRRAGAPVALRPREYDLLLALLRREGRVATRTELLHEVWSYEPDVVSRTVDVHVVELRRKLEPDPSHPRHLLTVRKTGYRLALAPAP